MSTIAAIVVAAGRGTRVAGAGLPKQYIDIAGEVLLTRTLRPLLAHPSIARVLVVIHPGNEALYRSAIEPIIDDVLAANPKSVEEFRAGKEKAFNALVGQIMKATKGKANPQQVNDLLRRKLGA